MMLKGAVQKSKIIKKKLNKNEKRYHVYHVLSLLLANASFTNLKMNLKPEG